MKYYIHPCTSAIEADIILMNSVGGSGAYQSEARAPRHKM